MDTKHRLDIANSIEKNGFWISLYGNKGPGVYFANHSRYSLTWGLRNVMICDVIADPRYVKRYKSEIISGSKQGMDSEYVVTDPSIIKPKYYIEYKYNKNVVIDIIKYHNDNIFVPHGQFGCSKCDLIKTRCDCEQVPVIDQNDILTVFENDENEQNNIKYSIELFDTFFNIMGSLIFGIILNVSNI